MSTRTPRHFRHGAGPRCLRGPRPATHVPHASIAQRCLAKPKSEAGSRIVRGYDILRRPEPQGLNIAATVLGPVLPGYGKGEGYEAEHAEEAGNHEGHSLGPAGGRDATKVNDPVFLPAEVAEESAHQALCLVVVG